MFGIFPHTESFTILYHSFSNTVEEMDRNVVGPQHLLRQISLILIDFSLTVKASTLIFIFGRGSAISSAKEGKSGSIYNLVKN